MPEEVAISPRRPDRFREVLPADRYEEFDRESERARELPAGRVVWNINSTARGGGVVELLRPLLAYARGAGVDVRWLVIESTPAFFDITKRIHVQALADRLNGGEARDMLAQLPEPLKSSIVVSESPDLMKVSGFVERIVAELGVSPEEARTRNAVFATLEEALTPGELHDVLVELPSGFFELLEARSAAGHR